MFYFLWTAAIVVVDAIMIGINIKLYREEHDRRYLWLIGALALGLLISLGGLTHEYFLP